MFPTTIAGSDEQLARQAVGIAKVAASCHRLCHVIDKFNGRSNRQRSLLSAMS